MIVPKRPRMRPFRRNRVTSEVSSQGEFEDLLHFINRLQDITSRLLWMRHLPEAPKWFHAVANPLPWWSQLRNMTDCCVRPRPTGGVSWTICWLSRLTPYRALPQVRVMPTSDSPSLHQLEIGVGMPEPASDAHGLLRKLKVPFT